MLRVSRALELYIGLGAELRAELRAEAIGIGFGCKLFVTIGILCLRARIRATLSIPRLIT